MYGSGGSAQVGQGLRQSPGLSKLGQQSFPSLILPIHSHGFPFPLIRVYNRVTPSVELSGPTNFAPLIYRAMEICHKRSDVSGGGRGLLGCQS